MIDFRTQDLRNKKQNLIHGRTVKITKTASVDKVAEMLRFLGEDESLAEETMGYLSLHGMQINLNNIEDYLKLKKSSKLDMRKK